MGVHLSSAPASLLPVTATATGATEPSMTLIMPNLIGSNLQSVQDPIQSLTDYVIAVTTSHDATGAAAIKSLTEAGKSARRMFHPAVSSTRTRELISAWVKLEERCP